MANPFGPRCLNMAQFNVPGARDFVVTAQESLTRFSAFPGYQAGADQGSAATQPERAGSFLIARSGDR